MFKIQGTGCYDINVTFVSSAKDGLPGFVCNWKRDVKVSDKNTMTFWHNFAYKPLNNNLQQGFGQKSKTGTPSIYI